MVYSLFIFFVNSSLPSFACSNFLKRTASYNEMAATRLRRRILAAPRLLISSILICV